MSSDKYNPRTDPKLEPLFSREEHDRAVQAAKNRPAVILEGKISHLAQALDRVFYILEEMQLTRYQTDLVIAARSHLGNVIDGM